MAKETILTMSSANIKYGFGATREIGFDMKELGARLEALLTVLPTGAPMMVPPLIVEIR